MSGRTPIIIGGKGNVQHAAAKAFVDMKVDVGVQKMVIASQNRLLFELVRRLGGEVRLKKSDVLEGDWELVTTEDPLTNELVLITRKCVDINVNGANSPTI